MHSAVAGICLPTCPLKAGKEALVESTGCTCFNIATVPDRQPYFEQYNLSQFNFSEQRASKLKQDRTISRRSCWLKICEMNMCVNIYVLASIVTWEAIRYKNIIPVMPSLHKTLYVTPVSQGPAPATPDILGFFGFPRELRVCDVSDKLRDQYIGSNPPMICTSDGRQDWDHGWRGETENLTLGASRKLPLITELSNVHFVLMLTYYAEGGHQKFDLTCALQMESSAGPIPWVYII